MPCELFIHIGSKSEYESKYMMNDDGQRMSGRTSLNGRYPEGVHDDVGQEEVIVCREEREVFGS